MKNLLIVSFLFLLVACVPKAEELELRPDDVDAPVVKFGFLDLQAQGPATIVTVNFTPVLDGLSAEQIDGLQSYILYANGERKGSCSKDQRQISTTLINNRNYILGMGIRYKSGNMIFTTLPGSAETTLNL